MASDVWSFGVLLWEIFSRGALPFGNLEIGDVAAAIADGARLEQPVDCPFSVYEIMVLSWNPTSTQRPTFAMIFSRLSQIQSSDSLFNMQAPPDIYPSTSYLEFVDDKTQAWFSSASSVICRDQSHSSVSRIAAQQPVVQSALQRAQLKTSEARSRLSSLTQPDGSGPMRRDATPKPTVSQGSPTHSAVPRLLSFSATSVVHEISSSSTDIAANTNNLRSNRESALSASSSKLSVKDQVQIARAASHSGARLQSFNRRRASIDISPDEARTIARFKVSSDSPEFIPEETSALPPTIQMPAWITRQSRGKMILALRGRILRTYTARRIAGHAIELGVIASSGLAFFQVVWAAAGWSMKDVIVAPPAASVEEVMRVLGDPASAVHLPLRIRLGLHETAHDAGDSLL